MKNIGLVKRSPMLPFVLDNLPEKFPLNLHEPSSCAQWCSYPLIMYNLYLNMTIRQAQYRCTEHMHHPKLKHRARTDWAVVSKTSTRAQGAPPLSRTQTELTSDSWHCKMSTAAKTNVEHRFEKNDKLTRNKSSKNKKVKLKYVFCVF